MNQGSDEGRVYKIDMEWVIVRPVVLQNKPAKGRYTAGPSARVAPLVPLSFDDCADRPASGSDRCTKLDRKNCERGFLRPECVS